MDEEVLTIAQIFHNKAWKDNVELITSNSY